MVASAPRPIHSPLVYGGISVLGIGALYTPNPMETLWSLALLSLTLRWFWWERYPGILLVCLLTPFVEVHTTVLESNNSGLTLNELYPGTGQGTFWMASIGFLAVLLGFRLALRRIWNNIHPRIEELRQAAQSISQSKLLIATIAINTGGVLLNQAIPWGSSIQQLETYYGSITNAATICFALHFWLTRQRPWLVLAVFAYLFITSFYSYFSSWRGPLTILLITIMVNFREFKLRQILTTTPLLIPLFIFVFLWQAVKSEYRMFLSSGERGQVIRVSRSEALSQFTQLATSAIAEERLLEEKNVQSTYRRAGYLEYFNGAVSKIPIEIPHENGNLLAESLTFAFVPRILAPNKGIKNDREKVERYTNFYFGENSFASFSLGHYCEAYIDWGPNGMMLHLFLYGAIGGLLVRITLKKGEKLNPLLAIGMLWAVMTHWGTFQQDMVTVAGRTGWGALCQLFIFFPIYKWTNQFILTKTGAARALQ